jgi:hypothetical protein
MPLPMADGDDPQIILRDGETLAEETVTHPDQPDDYIGADGRVWRHMNRGSNWRQVGNTHRRVYDPLHDEKAEDEQEYAEEQEDRPAR